MDASGTSSSRPFWVEALHIFAFVGIAVAQPLYSALAGGPEFLIAHNAGRLEITIFVLALSIGLPLAIIFIEAFARLVSLKAQRTLHLCMVWALLFVLALQTINRFFDHAVVIPVMLTFVVAALLVTFYAQSQTAGRLVSILAIGALLFPLNFLLFSPVSGIFLDGRSGEIVGADASQAKTPVVFVIFDEFNPTALLNEKGEIDAVRYPHFAELANDSWWFPRATSTHPQTQFAVPAILTGLFPNPDKDVPSYKEHPNNLFTMLGRDYSLNVRESLTSLCPNSICKQEQKRFNTVSFLSDIFVVFQHAVFPRALASAILPPLSNGWNRFDDMSDSAGGNPEELLIEKFNNLSDKSRLSSFREFISSINGADRELNFLHILLPHKPYQFFPNGTFYQRVGDFGMVNDIWPGEQSFIDVAYARFLMQVGLVDTLIGELVQKLKDVGAYDKSLVIITADHGRAFRPNVSDRALTTQNPDLLHVPLFIKLPGQTSGDVDRNLVSNIDIVPTIADVLGINLKWNLDGKSVFAEGKNENPDLSVFYEGKNFTFQRDEIVKLPLLDWQVNTFGSGTQLSELTIIGPYSDLLGQDIRTLDIVQEVRGEEPRLIQNLSMLDHVEIGSGFMPAVISSEIVGLRTQKLPWVALAMNNKVVALTQVYKGDKGSQRILTLLPPKSFINGRNVLSAFQIIGSGSDLQFLSIAAGSDTFQLESLENGSDILVSSSGEQYPVIKDKLFGSVDRADVDGSIIELAGWAAEIEVMKPATLVVAFIDGKFACAVNPNVDRVDVAKYFNSAAVEKSGFSTVCPFQSGSVVPGSLRAFAISPSKKVGELHVTGK